MEEIYIGTKIIAAEPLDERDFVFSKGQAWDETQPNRVGYRVRYEDGYVSWSPKETFERAYRKMTLKEAEMVAGGQFVVPNPSEPGMVTLHTVNVSVKV